MDEKRKRDIRVWAMRAGAALLAFLVVSQLIRPRTVNPAVDPAHEIGAHAEVDAATQAILERACNDCHSSHTIWPWYSYVAPVSWLVASDVNDGRRHVNFSEWETYPTEKRGKLLDQICKEVREGDMPPFQYLPMHRAAWLAKTDREQICSWTSAAKQGLVAVDGSRTP